ncbi:conserved hypothetical protein, membrane [Candidatus Magnetomorum sp. HK-1]|nr:conserved hypothetical protein, membrane [Candidatus Magnetomorum sp. HK-1]
MKSVDIRNLLLISGIWGFFVGLMHSNWQIAVEGGQFLAGLVHYSPEDPHFMFMNIAWTSLHQITALLLKVGISEKVLSIVISGIIAMVSCQAISGLVYIFSKSIFFSALFPLFYFLLEKKMPLGANYPIMLWDVPHTYGSLSLSLVILIIILLAFNKDRTAGFLLGLLPSIHIGWACFLYFILLIIWLFSEKKFSQLMTIFSGFFIGATISLISFLHFQYYQIPYPKFSSHIEKYINAFRQWDCHRMTIHISHPSILVNIIALLYSIYNLKQKNIDQNNQEIIYKSMIGASLLGGVAAIFSHFPDQTPLSIYQLMPTRLLNINAVCLIACVAGRLNTKDFRGYVFILIASAIYFLGQTTPFGLTVLIGFGIFLGLTIFREIFSKHYELWTNKFLHYYLVKQIPIILLLIIHIQYIVCNISHIHKFYLHTDTVMEAAKKMSGKLLTSSDMTLIQARTQCPVLLYGESLDMMMYALYSAPRIDKILNDIYAISLFDLPEKVVNKGGLTRYIDKLAWEKRSHEEWLKIKKKYYITHVLTYANYQLNLKLIKKNACYALYEI